MAQRGMTVDRFDEIARRLAAGRGVREIARSLGVAPQTVREVRDGLRKSPSEVKLRVDPLWMSQVDWPGVIRDLGAGHPLKFIWEEQAHSLTGYPNFFKQFYAKYPQYRQATVTAREFAPGERVEVDYAGGTLPWVTVSTGEIHLAFVFIAALGFSQKGFAWAAADMKSPQWLDCHRRMFEFYGGVTAVTAPDCLKTGVLKCHRYDPDLNPAYAQLGSHYDTAIVPARPAHPKDKAIVEGMVKLLMRYVRFKYRRIVFTSLAEVNAALTTCMASINARVHTRFRVSRNERFDSLEQPALKPLPIIEFDIAEWKDARLHADCYVSVQAAYYSAPHRFRGRVLRVKLTSTQVEIFHEQERIAIHLRDRQRCGARVKDESHFPEASRAYYEATPQKLLSQSRFICPALNQLFIDLFNRDVFGNLRRAQGLIATASKLLQDAGRDVAVALIECAIAKMRRFNKVRVRDFQQFIAQAQREQITTQEKAEREIQRQMSNPLLRFADGTLAHITDGVIVRLDADSVTHDLLNPATHTGAKNT